MQGKHIKMLRDHAALSQSDLAGMLNISSRTIAKWESEGDSPIIPLYVTAFRTLLENLVLAPVLRKCEEEKVFKKIPAELIAIWLVRYSLLPIQYPALEFGVPYSDTTFWEVILHENTARYQCLCVNTEVSNVCFWKLFCKEKRRYFNDRIHRNPHTDSLTTYPLRSGECIRLAGDDIDASSHKRVPGRVNHFYHDQLCHSLLHVPYHIPDVHGPQPVVLLSLENKLERDGNNQWHVIPCPEGASGEVFTKEDEETAKDLVKKIYENDLRDIIDAFDYLPSSV